MALFDDNVRKQLSDIFKNMKEPVSLAYATQEFECHTCKDTHAFVDELSSLSDKINLNVYDFVKDSDKCKSLNIDKIPAIAVLDRDNNDTGVKFYGLPGGYEINSFMQALLEASGHREKLPDSISGRIAAINKPVHIQVFVTLT